MSYYTDGLRVGKDGHIEHISKRQWKKENKKPKIVLVHGLFSSPKKFESYTRVLENKGYRVITVKHQMPLRPSDHRKVKRALELHSDAEHFIGHSYGGMAIASNKNIPENKIITLNSPYAKRGTNYTMNKDFLNVINPYSYLKSEHKLKGDHRTLPHLERLMNENNIRNYNRLMEKNY